MAIEVIVDVCVLISDGPSAVRWLSRRVKGDDQLLLDKPSGPCWLEIRRHSPSREGQELRRLEGRDDAYLISKRVHEVFMSLVRKAACTRVVAHNGEPRPPLRAELLALRDEHDLHDWWEKDRKWVSLAQTADAADLASLDRGFQRAADILNKHGIRVFSTIPNE